LNLYGEGLERHNLEDYIFKKNNLTEFVFFKGNQDRVSLKKSISRK
jgi:hypothetical protein